MTIRNWARLLKRDALVLWLAARDRRVAWPVKALAGVVAAYAFSPVDLIPDFIPVLGYLDDLVIVPAGIWLVVRLIPAPVLEDLRGKAAALADHPVSRTAAAVIAAVWLSLTMTSAWFAWRHLHRGA
ncbi:MAG: YkvA family protein [Novosphingobium sp.]